MPRYFSFLEVGIAGLVYILLFVRAEVRVSLLRIRFGLRFWSLLLV